MDSPVLSATKETHTNCQEKNNYKRARFPSNSLHSVQVNHDGLGKFLS